MTSQNTVITEVGIRVLLQYDGIELHAIRRSLN